MAQLDTQITLRLSTAARADLDQLAAEKRTTPIALARSLLEEGTRRAKYPGIGFRDGAAGRRACIEGSRLDVWLVMETIWASDGNIEEAADYLGVPPERARAAVAYYSDHPDEIDEWIRANQEEADRLEAEARRQQAAVRR